MNILHRWALPAGCRNARQRELKRFYNLKASEEVCLQTPKQPP